MTQDLKKFIGEVIQDPENDQQCILVLGTEVCDHLGWKPGDTLEWIDNKDGKWILRKSVTSSMTP